MKRKELWDFLQTKKGSNLFGTKKIDGLLWIRVRVQPFNLIKELAKFKQTEHQQKPGYNYNYGKVGPERRQAIWMAMHGMDIRPSEDRCLTLFNTYISRTNNAEIVLVPDPDKFFTGDLLTLPYKTRFNDEGRKVEQLKKYERIFDETAQKYKNAVFLTLTIDPKKQHNLWTTNKEVPKAWNRLMSFLTRREGKKGKGRPEYLNVYEFQKNGRLHLHIVFFNMNYIIPGNELSKLWDRYGQGRIVKFLRLRSDGNNWQWARERPKDSRGSKPEKYLKKYLKKNLYDETASMQYWMYNTRFFTNSRVFEIARPKLPSLGWYRFLGVFYEGDAPRHNPNVYAWGVGVDPPKKKEPSEAYKQMMKLSQLNY